MQETLDRRDLLKAGALAAVAAGRSAGAATPPLRAGLVGAGARGTALLEILLGLEGVEVPAVCDVNENVVARALQTIQARGRGKAEGYSRSATDYQRLCGREDLDVVLIATPPALHARIATEAMKAGKHAATEPPAALSLEDCSQLVETAEKTGRHCAMLAANCYTRQSLMLLSMFRGGLLGDPLFAETGYCRDLRSRGGAGAAAARAVEPIAPVAWWMNVNRGDRFTAVSSMRTKTAAIGTALVRTAQGRMISLYVDTATPRPPEGLMRVQGSKGCYSGQVNKIFVDGRSNRSEGPNWLHNPAFEDMTPYEKEFAPPLWNTQGDRAKGSAEYMALYRLVKNLRERQAPDIDVYDAAAWTAVGVLLEQSAGAGSRVMDVPDFTRGKWERRAPVEADAIV